MDPNNSETQDIVDTVATENTDAVSQEHDEQGREQQPEQEQQTQEQEEVQKAEQEQQKKSRAQERIEKLARENAELKRWRAEQEQRAQQPEKASERPNIADYEDVNDYYKAVDDYQINQAMQRFKNEQSQATQQAEQIKREAEFNTAIAELVDEGVDYAAYVQKANELPPLPVTLDQFGLDPKQALLVGKALLDDPETYIELSQMSVVQASIKIGQIIAKTSAKTVPTSKAPPPLKPTKANAPASRSPESMSDKEWLEWRNSQIKSKKGK